KDEPEYRAAKKNIVLWQGSEDFAVLNHKSTFSPATIKSLRSQIKYFSSENSLVDCAIIDDNGESRVILDPQNRNIEICKISDLLIVGRHNLENVAAAAIVADIMKVPVEIIREAVKRFVGLPHRLELVREINKVKYINDSFATSPDPTMAAINSFDNAKVLILGGSSKGADFTELAEMIAGTNVESIVLIGVEGPKIRKVLKSADYDGRLVSGGDSIEKIVGKASVEADRGDVVLFSPACASFDMFKNYKVRGDKFREAVLKLNPNVEIRNPKQIKNLKNSKFKTF
ncbi:MAG: cyanophycin synthetase, partial [bacterium]|nr:cyanophycin synthetase [bacterium]